MGVGCWRDCRGCGDRILADGTLSLADQYCEECWEDVPATLKVKGVAS